MRVQRNTLIILLCFVNYSGASRGIGFGLVKHLLENIEGLRVVATARNLATSTQLTDLAKTYPKERLVLVQLDTASAESYKTASADLAAAGVTSLDALVANAGIGARYNTLECPVADALDNYNTNVVGSMLTVQAFHSLLDGPKVVAFVSSIMGSIHLASGECVCCLLLCSYVPMLLCCMFV